MNSSPKIQSSHIFTFFCLIHFWYLINLFCISQCLPYTVCILGSELCPALCSCTFQVDLLTSLDTKVRLAVVYSDIRHNMYTSSYVPHLDLFLGYTRSKTPALHMRRHKFWLTQKVWRQHLFLQYMSFPPFHVCIVVPLIFLFLFLCFSLFAFSTKQLFFPLLCSPSLSSILHSV